MRAAWWWAVTGHGADMFAAHLESLRTPRLRDDNVGLVVGHNGARKGLRAKLVNLGNIEIGTLLHTTPSLSYQFYAVLLDCVALQSREHDHGIGQHIGCGHRLVGCAMLCLLSSVAGRSGTRHA